LLCERSQCPKQRCVRGKGTNVNRSQHLLKGKADHRVASKDCVRGAAACLLILVAGSTSCSSTARAPSVDALAGGSVDAGVAVALVRCYYELLIVRVTLYYESASIAGWLLLKTVSALIRAVLEGSHVSTIALGTIATATAGVTTT
jgi:hypothetical protein